MSLLDKLSKLGDVILKPVEAMTDWTKEPLRKWDHERNEEAKVKEHNRKVEQELRQKTVEANLQNEKINFESKIKMNEDSAKLERELKQKEVETELEIKKETEIKKILIELDEWKKDQEIQRMERVSEAIMRYQEQLTKLNVNATNAIGHMQLELRERAQELVYYKTIKYKELQDLALKEAMADLEKIDASFSNNEIAKNILIKAVDKKLSNIIDTAQNFLLELNSDIKLLNQSINLLTERGQSFIESHLAHFHVAELPMNEIKMINDHSKINN
jgi:hypothetical protein